MGFERNYRANIPSKQFNIRKLSTFKHTYKNPWVITGLIDSEGSFSIIIDKNKTRKSPTLSSSQEIDREKDFFEWLCGLVDGEGSFYIKHTGKSTFSFRFQICLHIDDLAMLLFIQKTLGFGRIYTTKAQAYFDVTKLKDVAKIIAIFTNFPLNTTKSLNFRDFKKAFELYVSNTEKSLELIQEIETLKNGMNTQRYNFENSESKKFRITSYWLLGFIEGEGSFHILNKDFYPRFSIGQSNKDLALMEELKSFLNNLGKTLNRPNLKDAAYLSISKDINMVSLVINQSDYITNVLIPFLDNLTWHSKKELDYQDWKAILKIITLGLHYTEEGAKVINLILSQMNNNRLSSKSTISVGIDRALLQAEIDKLLKEGSNLEEREDGRIFSKSLNRYLPPANIGVELKDQDGLVLNTFASLSDCAKYLGIPRSTITRRLRNNEPILVNGKFIYINKVGDGDGVIPLRPLELGWRVQTKFQLGVHIKDLNLLRQLQEYLDGIGSIHISRDKNRVNFSVNSKKDLMKLINHLEKYPLQTQKAADFFLFKQAVELISNKAHITTEGLNQIVNIKSSMNWGLSDMLKSEFAGFTPVKKPIIVNDNIPHPSWISGFVSGDGNFDVRISPSSNKVGYRIQLRFRITQHERDLKLMENIVKYFGSGNIYKYSGKSAVSLTIVNFTYITNIIIPFFNENPLVGVKLYDYLDWCKIHKLMKDGLHLTLEGLDQIRKIKTGMNTGRK